MPAGRAGLQAIKEISRLGLKAKIYTFARTKTADIDRALECGSKGVNRQALSVIRCTSSNGLGGR
jgi:hypothetical protein